MSTAPAMSGALAGSLRKTSAIVTETSGAVPKIIETREEPDSRIATVTKICAAPGERSPASRNGQADDEVQAARRRLGRCGDESDDERGAGGRDRPERGVRVAVERHPQRHAHRAEEERRRERQPDGGYTASSAPSGVGRPRAKSGMNTCASGPIDSA